MKKTLSRSVNSDSDEAILSCGVEHEDEDVKNLVLSWFHNQDPTPFLLWRLRDSAPDIFGRRFHVRNTKFVVKKTTRGLTLTKLFIADSNVMMSGKHRL